MNNDDQQFAEPASSFKDQQHLQQAKFFANCDDAVTADEGEAWQLMPESWEANLNPDYRRRIVDSFSYSDENTQSIDWHKEKHNGASSQICCVNFLFPFADRPELLARWIDHVLGVKGAQPEVIERRNGEDHYVAFEWFPETDYFKEAGRGGKRHRGRFNTSIDAAVRYRIADELHLLLIKWKYIKNDDSKLGAAGDPTRIDRYHNLWQRPHGPVRPDLDVELTDFFLEPWYQLLRQQMTAYHAEIDPLSGFDRVALLHISPKENSDLRRAKGGLARFGEDLFEAFGSMIHPAFRDRFIPVDTSFAFGCVRNWPEPTWTEYLAERYPDLF